jgi:hypothetical protein
LADRLSVGGGVCVMSMQHQLRANANLYARIGQHILPAHAQSRTSFDYGDNQHIKKYTCNVMYEAVSMIAFFKLVFVLIYYKIRLKICFSVQIYDVYPLIRFGVLSVSTSSSFDDVDVAAVICF